MINVYTEMTQRWLKILSSGLLAVMVVGIVGCGKSDGDGDVATLIELPTDDTIPLDLECADVGLFTETCVLDDSTNPYRNSVITEDNKFDLDAEAPSFTAKFFLWATALARGIGAPGENQFYVAYNLHLMWGASNSELTRLQALRAYRSYLDNYFDSLTYFEIPLESEIFFPQSLNLFTGQLLFDPTTATNTYTGPRLFNPDPMVNRDMASVEVGDWGYVYLQDTERFEKNP